MRQVVPAMTGRRRSTSEAVEKVFTSNCHHIRRVPDAAWRRGRAHGAGWILTDGWDGDGNGNVPPW